MEDQQPPSDCETVMSQTSEIEPKVNQPSKGKHDFTIVEIVEMMFLLGLTSYSMWDKVIPAVGKLEKAKSDPLLLQLYNVFMQLTNAFSEHILSHCNFSQKKIQMYYEEDKTLKEILTILNPLLRKKTFKEKVFQLEIVDKFNNLVRKLVNKKDEESNVEVGKKRKLKSKKKSSKKSKKSSSSSESSSESSDYSSSVESNSDTEDEFGKLFTETGKSKSPFISQQFQFVTGKNERKKISSPGEQGSHLIKIEITDTKDLKKCANEKVYWQKVCKKGYFLLDTKNSEDQDTLKSLDAILVNACKKLKKNIPNVKQEKLDYKFKK